MFRKYIKFLPGLAIVLVAISIISWAIVQEPLVLPDSSIQHENSIPFYVPPSSYG